MMDKIYDVKNAIADIFYGLWANMLSWKVYQRAMLVLLIVLVLFGVVLFLSIKLLGKLLKAVGKKVVEGIFLVWQNFLVFGNTAEEHTKKIQRINQTTEKFSSYTEKIESFGDKLIKFRAGKARYYIFFYTICIFLIGLPDMLSGFVNENYSHIFSFGRTIYCNWESSINEKAEAYEPIIVKTEDEESEDFETEENTISEEDVIWLQLSNAGINGTNIRSGPGAEYDRIDVLSGEIRMRYVAEADQWCCVELENGTKGWINRKLLERIE